jgi:uncharacterized cupin superfamily protein
MAALPSMHGCRGGKMMTLTLRVTREDVVPEVTRPDAAKVLSGDPVHTTWNLETRGNIYAGMWHTTVGEWRCDYTEWEYVYIHEGHSVLTDEAGVQVHLRAGDSWVIRPGFKGIWAALEPTLKDYVVVV